MAKLPNRRYELQTKLESITKNVYYQPPANYSIGYPCIVYNLSGIDTNRANDSLYLATNQYQITIIDRDPDSELPHKVLSSFQSSSFTSFYVSDNLNHTILSLYY